MRGGEGERAYAGACRGEGGLPVVEVIRGRGLIRVACVPEGLDGYVDGCVVLCLAVSEDSLVAGCSRDPTAYSATRV